MNKEYTSFRKAAFGGFNRRDVISYIEKMRNESFEYKKQVEETVKSLNEKIRELNRDYREKDSATDVLSFPMYDDFDSELLNIGTVPLGDIVISLERAIKQGHDLFHSVYHELAFLSIHSTLHLLGYDHETSKEDEEEMFSRQRKIMEIMLLYNQKFKNMKQR